LDKILKIVSYSSAKPNNPSNDQLEGKYVAYNLDQQLPVLKPNKQYLVLAVEYPSDAAHAQFWVIGEHSSQLRDSGIFFPDIINANECKIADPKIPCNWRIGVFHYISGTRTIIGPPEVIAASFLERLSNSESEAIKIFQKLLIGHELENTS
jgi:hypothetical protein